MTNTQNKPATQKAKRKAKPNLDDLLNYRFDNDESAELIRKFKENKDSIKESLAYTAFTLLEHNEWLSEIHPTLDRAPGDYLHSTFVKGEVLADFYLFVDKL